MTLPAIQVCNLRKQFHRRRKRRRTDAPEAWALAGVSFEVARGDTYGLLGPNGSGKSTALRLLLGFLRPTAGRATIAGHDCWRDGVAARRLIAYLPEEQARVRWLIGRVSVDAAFYKKLSTRENLLYTALLYGLDPASAERKAMHVLEQLGMEQRTFSAPLEEMSRGMQQKISIARALMINPPLLLLDEPTTGLDPKSRRDVQAFLEDLRRREGTTILLTTHDMAEAERLCARIGFLAHGRLVAEGTAEGLRRQASAATLDDAFIGLTEETAAAGDTPTGAPPSR